MTHDGTGPVRRRPLAVRRGALPLARGRRGARRAGGDRAHGRRRRSWPWRHRDAAARGGAVPPRVDPDEHGAGWSATSWRRPAVTPAGPAAAGDPAATRGGVRAAATSRRGCSGSTAAAPAAGRARRSRPSACSAEDDVSLTFDARDARGRRATSTARAEVVGDDVFAVLEDELDRDGGDPDVSWVGYLGYACRPDLPGRRPSPGRRAGRGLDARPLAATCHLLADVIRRGRRSDRPDDVREERRRRRSGVPRGVRRRRSREVQERAARRQLLRGEPDLPRRDRCPRSTR